MKIIRIILLTFSVVAVLVTACNAFQQPTETEPEVLVVTATPEATEVIAEPETEEAPEVEEPTVMPEPGTEVETEAPTAPPEAGGLGYPGNPVTANSQWTPVIQEFEGMEFALVPVGCFKMGADDSSATGAERPVHDQCFETPYWIGVTEVTNAQAETGAVEYQAEHGYRGDNVPRNNVTWFEAKALCESIGARLPTEVEWEYAARGPDSLRWPFGNEFVSGIVVYAVTYLSPIDVGQFWQAASWVGAFDIAGNVREWTSSGRADYPYDAGDGREITTASGNPQRIVRGGGYMSGQEGVRSSFREWYDWNGYTADIGFRCARDY